MNPNQEFAAFLDEAPFRGTIDARSFTFTSTAPVSAVALRGHINERGDFLMTTLPITEISSSSMASAVLPYFAAGGGWTTKILLVNPTEHVVTGNVDMETIYPYSIPPRSAVQITTPDSGSLVRTGVVRITPASGSGVPVASSVFTLVSGGITVTESGVAATGIAQSFRIFAEVDPARSLQTGIAIANTASSVATVQFELLTLNGEQSGYSGSTTVSANGHLALFLTEIPGFQNLPMPFRGVLRISSNTPISTMGLRERYNERGDFLISATPSIGDNAATSASELIFPRVVAGGGYTTEFVLVNPGNASQGTAVFRSQSGTELPLQLLR